MILKASSRAAVAFALLASTSFADFTKCGFNVGVDLKQASTKKCSYMGCTKNVGDLDIPTGLDFVAMFVGYAYEGGKVAPKPLDTPEGTFLAMATSLNATPVWYTYIIAEGAKLAKGLSDCNQGSAKTLCTDGTAYIRGSRSTILDQYSAYAKFAASKYGTSKPMIWALEPDFYQYASSQNGNSSPLSYSDAASMISDIVSAIKTAMPNAVISMDISPWAPDGWFTALPLSKFTYMNTSGGISQPGDKINSSNPMTWAHLHELTKLPILADDGYGTGGTLTNPNSGWSNSSNITARMKDGVVGLMEASPGSSWTSTISAIHTQTSGSCQTNPTNYTLNVTSGNGGSVSVTPTGTSFAEGTSVKLKAVPQSGFRFTGWTGGVTGMKDTITVVMNSNMNITAGFAQIQKYTLTINTPTGGTITATPSGTSFDSGTTVGLKAKSSTGYSFTSWGGVVSGTTDSVTLVMNGNKNVSATFTKSIGVIPVDRRLDKIRLNGNQLSVSMGRSGLVRFAIVSLDGRVSHDLGSIEMNGQEQIFGLEHRPSGLAYLHMRGEGWEMVVPMASAR